MPSPSRALVLALLFAVCHGFAAAGERVVSQSGLVDGVFDHEGFSIAPARDPQPRQYSHDPGPTQAFEIVRPGQGPIRIGRLHTSCSCLELSAAKRDFAQGERALLELRNVKPTVGGGATYSFFVQITEPVRETLRYDVFVDTNAPRPVPVETLRPESRVASPPPMPPRQPIRPRAPAASRASESPWGTGSAVAIPYDELRPATPHDPTSRSPWTSSPRVNPAPRR
ncbi:MAG: hypothetical protein LBJ46_10950 [Planctomycetota bacterium]|nr:hypothetical protein [Planctomycetota bacterium]